MRHEPNTRGNCAACSALWTGAGKRRIEPWPCPIVLLARERLENARLREQVRVLGAADALRAEEMAELRAVVCSLERRRDRQVLSLDELTALTARRYVTAMEARGRWTT